jgi:methionyl-tRNA synthetase
MLAIIGGEPVRFAPFVDLFKRALVEAKQPEQPIGCHSPGHVAETDQQARDESELANDLGNLASRTIAMVHRYRDGTVPDAPLDPDLAAEVDGLNGEVCALLDRADPTGAADAIWLRVRRLNRYVEEQAPWTLAKDPARAGELDTVLASLAEALRVVAVLLHPWIPESSDKLLAALAAPELDLDGARMQPGRLGAIVKLDQLFPKH